MKKVLAFLLVLTLTLGMSLSAFAASDKSNNGNGKGNGKSGSQSTEVTNNTTTPTLDGWSVSAHRNLIKFEGPKYMKGGKIMVPIQAIKHQLGVEVFWDEVAQTVTIAKEGTGVTVVFGMNSISATLTQAETIDNLESALQDLGNGTFDGTVTGMASGGVSGTMEGTLAGTIGVDGILDGTLTGTIINPETMLPVDPAISVTGTVSGTLASPIITLDPQADIATALDTPVPAELTNGRAYVPLKFLAETFGKEASYDPET
ncbi:MAG: stalk domain-containing protein, partial [Firmicutes bacterium]|nr:stalk domain-containing protein [Bacillota bacterium]